MIPPDFATSDGQAAALGGRVILYCAQSPHFINAVYNASAVTAKLPPATAPTALSLNNAFGRVWIANAPLGNAGAGLESVNDPDGRPLAEAPSKTAGGVFFGNQTDRATQQIAGSLTTAAIGTALLGRSPDGGGRAVFAVVHADGSITQVHVEKGADGLAPTGTIAPLTADGATNAAAWHAGVALNWVPDRILYVADPKRDAIVAVSLADDGVLFRVKDKRALVPMDEGRRALAMPVDLAPAVPEIANPGFSSNTTLAGASDLYVVNRGNGTIARIRQDGIVVATRSIRLPDGTYVGPNQLTGIATKHDASRIYVTLDSVVSGFSGRTGAVLEVAAFGAPGQTAQADRSSASVAASPRDVGETLFRDGFTAAMGLGPLINGTSCAECHREPSLGGMGALGLATVVRVGALRGERFDDLAGRGGPIARTKSAPALAPTCELHPGIPAGANVTSIRNAPQLYGLGLIDQIPDATLAAIAASQRVDLRGRIHWVDGVDGTRHAGKFGWKDDVPTLQLFVAHALRNEHGITNPFLPTDILVAGESSNGCIAEREGPDDDGTLVGSLTAYVASLEPPSPKAPPSFGARVFETIGCSACHTPIIHAAAREVHLYSDLLLHDLGPLLDDGVTQGAATGHDWRTAPLWGLSERRRFLHDGRATTLDAAIAAHGGQAASVVGHYRTLPESSRRALIEFLTAL